MKQLSVDYVKQKNSSIYGTVFRAACFIWLLFSLDILYFLLLPLHTLILLLLFFTLVNYVRPIYRMVDGINSYRTSGRRYTYDFDGDDQLAEINTGVTEIIEENLELKTRIKALRENLEKTNQQ